jgi:hypothetical protein
MRAYEKGKTKRRDFVVRKKLEFLLNQSFKSLMQELIIK